MFEMSPKNVYLVYIFHRFNKYTFLDRGGIISHNALRVILKLF